MKHSHPEVAQGDRGIFHMWLIIVVIAYFLNALAAVVDKFLISKKIPNPAVYVFYITLLGLLGLVLAPWGFSWPGGINFGVNLLAGLSFAFALQYLFKALALGDSSRVTPFIGGLSPIFVLIFSFWLLSERLSWPQMAAFALIVVGTIVISYGKNAKSSGKRSFIGWAVLSALLFGVSYTLTKYAYLHQNFVSAFVWMRLTSFLGALLLLLRRENYLAIKASRQSTDAKVGGLFIFGQVAGALSFVLVNYAISLASVTLVNALQGLQYVFLLIMVLLLAKWYPNVLSEKLKGWILVQKIIAIILVGIGLVLLV